MAKITITLEDAEDGEIVLQTTTDPPLRKGDSPTPAQRVLMEMLQALREGNA